MYELALSAWKASKQRLCEHFGNKNFRNTSLYFHAITYILVRHFHSPSGMGIQQHNKVVHHQAVDVFYAMKVEQVRRSGTPAIMMF